MIRQTGDTTDETDQTDWGRVTQVITDTDRRRQTHHAHKETNTPHTYTDGAGGEACATPEPAIAPPPKTPAPVTPNPLPPSSPGLT